MINPDLVLDLFRLEHAERVRRAETRQQLLDTARELRRQTARAHR